jgi:hypothetical protein
VAVCCPHCGKALPRENARFCNNCGRFLPPRQSPTPASEELASSSQRPGEPAAPPDVPRSPFPAAAPADEAPPAWLGQLDREITSRRLRGLRRSLSPLPAQDPAGSSAQEQQVLTPPASLDRPGGPASQQRPQDMSLPASPEVLRRERLADAPTSAVPALPSAGSSGPLPASPTGFERPTPAPLAPPATSQPEAGQQDAPAAPLSGPLAARPTTPRELRVRVWEESETMIMPMEGKPAAMPREEQPGQESPPLPAAPSLSSVPPVQSEAGRPPAFPGVPERKQAIEDLPTMPLTVIPGPGLVIERGSTPRPARTDTSFSPLGPGRFPATPAGLDELDTMRLAAQAAPTTGPVSPGMHAFPAPSELHPREEGASWQSGPQPVFRELGALQVPSALRSSPAIEAGERSEREQEPADGRSSRRSADELAAAASKKARRRGRKRFVVLVLLVLLLLLGGGLAAWILIYQPFSIPLVTQPQQTFRDQRLGLMLSYPRDWSSHVDYQQGEVSFSDSTHTGQMVIRVVAAGGQSAVEYLQKEVARLGLSNLKSEGPLVFAGATWQRAEGTLLVAGASYIETLFVTSHAGRLYTLAQLAHQQIYSAEEQEVFAPTRASLRFLA